MQAKYNSRCAKCGGTISKGDLIRPHNLGWGHQVCPTNLFETPEADPMARFDAEIQKREIEQDQRAFERKLDAEMAVNRPGVLCLAPTGPLHQPGPRCMKPLGEEDNFYASRSCRVRICPDGHVSFRCDACRLTDFAICSFPEGEHETFIGTYFCRHCHHPVFAEEGLNAKWGEVVQPQPPPEPPKPPPYSRRRW